MTKQFHDNEEFKKRLRHENRWQDPSLDDPSTRVLRFLNNYAGGDWALKENRPSPWNDRSSEYVRFAYYSDREFGFVQSRNVHGKLDIILAKALPDNPALWEIIVSSPAKNRYFHAVAFVYDNVMVPYHIYTDTQHDVQTFVHVFRTTDSACRVEQTAFDLQGRYSRHHRSTDVIDCKTRITEALQSHLYSVMDVWVPQPPTTPSLPDVLPNAHTTNMRHSIDAINKAIVEGKRLVEEERLRPSVAVADDRKLMKMGALDKKYMPIVEIHTLPGLKRDLVLEEETLRRMEALYAEAGAHRRLFDKAADSQAPDNQHQN